MAVGTVALLLRPHMELGVSPTLLVQARLLACSQQELVAAIGREVERNPALEALPTPSCPGCGRPSNHPGCAACGARYSVAAHVGCPTTGLDTPDWLPHRPGASESLLADAMAALPERDRWLAAWLLGELDERGFLGRAPDSIADELGVDRARLRGVIEAIRAEGPPGICAIDAVDCLLVQLQKYEARGEAPLTVRPLIQHHLADLAAGRIAAIAGALRITTDDVLAARDFIRARLRPWATLDDSQAAPPVAAPPDLVIRRVAPEVLDVEVDTAARRGVRLDPAWAALPTGTGAERRWVRAYAEQARTFLDALDQRATTLRRIGVAVAEHQRQHLLGAQAAPAPLTRAAIAAALELHESTVSRAVAGKRVRRPDGRVVPFAALFGVNGSVLAALRGLVADEPRALSDAELAAELCALGHPVARRTVAKYRSQLGIPARGSR